MVMTIQKSSFFHQDTPACKAIPILNAPNEPKKAEQVAAVGQDGIPIPTFPITITEKPIWRRPLLTSVEKERNPLEEFEFHGFDNFIIFDYSIRQMCEKTNACDVHIVFKERIQSVPRVGLSCLSFDELLADAAKLKGATIEDLPWIKKLPQQRDGIETSWVKSIPGRNDTLTISLDLCNFALNTKSILARCTFRKESTSWMEVSYPLYTKDFSLIIAIDRNSIDAVKILSTYGWLNYKMKLQFMATCKDAKKARMASSMQFAGLALDGPECIICHGDDPADTILYPCMHAGMHAECLEGMKDTLTTFANACPSCRKNWTRTITYRRTFGKCIFCEGANTECEFNAIFLPCGCVPGCHDGFESMAKNYKIGDHCPGCEEPIKEVKKFFF